MAHEALYERLMCLDEIGGGKPDINRWTLRIIERALVDWDDVDKRHELVIRVFHRGDLPHPRDFDKQEDPLLAAAVYERICSILSAVIYAQYFILLNRSEDASKR